MVEAHGLLVDSPLSSDHDQSLCAHILPARMMQPILPVDILSLRSVVRSAARMPTRQVFHCPCELVNQ
jgi:hypothetical protein